MKNNIRMPGNVPILRKKTKAELDMEKYKKELLTREQIAMEFAVPMQNILNRALINISAIVTTLVEKGLFTEEEFEANLNIALEAFDRSIREKFGQPQEEKKEDIKNDDGI